MPSKLNNKSKSRDETQDYQKMTSYDFFSLGSGAFAAIAGGLVGASAFRGNEWWHIKREYTEVWLGLQKTCYNWRGQYDCQDHLYENFESNDCSVAGDEVKGRYSVVYFICILSTVLSILSAALAVAVAVKFRFSSKVVRGCCFLCFVTFLASVSALGIFYQTQASFAYCEDYCAHLEGSCVSEHGGTMRFVIGGCVMSFLSLLLSLFKNFDRRTQENFMANQKGEEDEEFTTLDSPRRAEGPRKMKTLPGPTGRRRSTRQDVYGYDGDDMASEAETIPAQRRTPAQNRRGVQSPRKNPVKHVEAPVEEEYYCAPQEEEEFVEEEHVEENPVLTAYDDPSAYADETFDDGALGAAAEYNNEVEVQATEAEEGDGDLFWDEDAGMYWSNEKQLHYDVESGHYFDAPSGQWYDPSTDLWYEV